MTIDEVIANLQSEKQEKVKSRFPCRAIMCSNIKQYCELLSKLREISDVEFVRSNEIFSGDDVMPQYKNLRKTDNCNKWLVLTGVSEYLRLFSKKEASDHRFADLWKYMTSSFSTGRIIIPLWDCKAQWFDKSLNLCSDERQQDFYYDCIDRDLPEQKMDVQVYSTAFAPYLSKLIKFNTGVFHNMREWFEYWADPDPQLTVFVLLTGRYQNISVTEGNISIHVLDNVLSFVKANMKGSDVLTDENCSEEMQNILLSYALQGKSLDDALLNIFNMTVFDGVEVMGKWHSFNDSKKMFTKLWFNIHPDNTYLSHCFSIAKELTDILNIIMVEIFNLMEQYPQWITEYNRLSAVMRLEPDKNVFDALDKITSYEKRLEFISGNSRNERIYVLHMVGKWLREDRNQVLSSKRLDIIYPELLAYLNSNSDCFDEELKSYMLRYKMHKLENSLPQDEDMYFNEFNTDAYDNRYAVLSENIDTDTFILWIDAFGVEWLPLLEWSLHTNCDCKFRNAHVTQACLPTETKFNDLWERMDVPYRKLDKLDKLAHKGVTDEPDYYSCVQEQIEFVVNIHKTVSELLGKYHRVIITGDHGTSRLAARFFHTREGMDAPKNSIICSHGRYCELMQPYPIAIPNTVQKNGDDGKKYLIFQNYDHFKKSGYAAGGDDDNAIYGEIHGGASPEEVLVPIVVVDSKKEIPLTAEWERNTARVVMKKVKLVLKFSKPVNHLQVKAGGIDAAVTPTSDKTKWNVVFENLQPGTYSVQAGANNKLISIPDITIVSAISGDGDLP